MRMNERGNGRCGIGGAAGCGRCGFGTAGDLLDRKSVV